MHRLRLQRFLWSFRSADVCVLVRTFCSRRGEITSGLVPGTAADRPACCRFVVLQVRVLRRAGSLDGAHAASSEDSASSPRPGSWCVKTEYAYFWSRAARRHLQKVFGLTLCMLAYLQARAARLRRAVLPGGARKMMARRGTQQSPCALHGGAPRRILSRQDLGLCSTPRLGHMRSSTPCIALRARGGGRRHEETTPRGQRLKGRGRTGSTRVCQCLN